MTKELLNSLYVILYIFKSHLQNTKHLYNANIVQMFCVYWAVYEWDTDVDKNNKFNDYVCIHRRCSDVESTSTTLIQRCNNVDIICSHKLCSYVKIISPLKR